jgi:hypothetical protein
VSAGDQFCEQCGHPLSGPAGEWAAVVCADRAHYDTAGIDDVAFPAHFPARTVELVGDEIRIGRHSARRPGAGVPELDLAEDTGVSHVHAVLRRTPAGWSVTDLGSRNGTRLNDKPLAPNQPAVLAPGDRLYLGAWTSVEFISRGPHPGR